MYTKLNQITVKELRETCTMIHYFGLGFIQIKLNTSNRIHIYTDLLPPITDKEDIHNHRYDFSSTIIYGTLHQELFMITPGSTHRLEKESCKEGEVPVREDAPICSIQKIGEQHFAVGSTYTINHNAFHRVSSNNAITFLTRSEYTQDLAEVIRPINAPRICPFSKKIPEEKLWEIVSAVLERAKVADKERI